MTHFQRIDIDSTGITFTETVRLPTELDDLPRVGTTFSVGAAFDRVRWFGRGPHECYPDRQSSAMAAVWDGGIDRLPYLVPQEFGLRTECRWFALEAPRSASGSAWRASTACSTARPPTIATPTSTPPPTRPSSRPAPRSSSTPMPATAASARPAAVRTPCGSTASARAPGAGAGGCRPTGCRRLTRRRGGRRAGPDRRQPASRGCGSGRQVVDEAAQALRVRREALDPRGDGVVAQEAVRVHGGVEDGDAVVELGRAAHQHEDPVAVPGDGLAAAEQRPDLVGQAPPGPRCARTARARPARRRPPPARRPGPARRRATAQCS